MSNIYDCLSVLTDLCEREAEAMSFLSQQTVYFTEQDKCDRLASLVDYLFDDNPRAVKSFNQFINIKAREVAQLEARTKRNV